MKKLFLFLAVASTSMFVSCSKDDEPNPTPAPVATAIVLTSNHATIELGQSVTLKVMNDLALDVTNMSTFTANDAAISGATFTPTAAGTFAVKATNGSLLSNTVTITVTEPAPGKFTYNGEEYDLDNMVLVAHGDADAGMTTFVDNGGVVGTLWLGILFDGPEDGIATAANYMEFKFFIPAIDNGDGTYTEQFPSEVAATALSIYSEINLNAVDMSTVAAGAVTFNTLVMGDVSTSDNASDFTNAGNVTQFSHEFNGELIGVFLDDLLGGKSVKKNRSLPTSKMVNLNNLKRTGLKSQKIQTVKF